MRKGQLVAIAVVISLVVMAIAGLLGFALLLVLAMMVLLGLIILAAELARPIINARRQVVGDRRRGD